MSPQEAVRRRPESGGYLRGEETRTRIITTALQVFGELGFDQASTRFIAAQAGVNPPALQYYFDSKAGLHRACVQHIIDATLLWLDPLLGRARELVAARDPLAAGELVCDIADALIDAILHSGTETWSRFLARTKAEGDGPGMELLRAKVGSRLIDGMSELLAVATRRPHGEDTRLQASMFVGLIGWFSTNRTGVLDIMHWSEFDRDRVALMKQLTRRQIRATLAAMAAEPAAPKPRRAANSKSRHRPV